MRLYLVTLITLYIEKLSHFERINLILYLILYLIRFNCSTKWDSFNFEWDWDTIRLLKATQHIPKDMSKYLDFHQDHNIQLIEEGICFFIKIRVLEIIFTTKRERDYKASPIKFHHCNGTICYYLQPWLKQSM